MLKPVRSPKQGQQSEEDLPPMENNKTLIELAAGHGMPCRVEPVSCERLEAAHEVMLVNSLIGIWPVARLGSRTWDSFETAIRMRKWLHALADASA